MTSRCVSLLFDSFHKTIWKFNWFNGMFKNLYSGESLWKETFSVTDFTWCLWIKNKSESEKKSIFETKMDKNFVSSILARFSCQIIQCPISALLSIKLYTCSVKEKWYIGILWDVLIVMLFNWWYETKAREAGGVRIEGNKIVSHDPSSP